MLPKSVQAVAEKHLGVSIEGTYVDDGTAGQQKAERETALAVTEGSRIAFGDGQLSTSTESGKMLLGHELVHVAQQRLAGRHSRQRQAKSWHQVVPTGKGLKAIPKQKLAPGEKPSLVVTGPDQQPVPAERPPDLNSEAKTACDTIAERRKSFSPRTGLAVQGPGYMYGGSAEHKKWYAGYAQDQIDRSSSAMERAQRETFFDIAQKEGFTSSMNTYEPVGGKGGGRETFGVGFAASGFQLQGVLHKLFAKLPDLAGQLDAIGVSLTGNSFTVVDTARCLQFSGVGADYVIMVTPSILEFLIRLAESVETAPGGKAVREVVADAQFEQFKTVAGSFPPWALSLPRTVRSFIAHAVHAGGTWGGYAGAVTLASAVRRFAGAKGQAASGPIVASANRFAQLTRMAGEPLSALELVGVDPKGIRKTESRQPTAEETELLAALELERGAAARWLNEHRQFAEDFDALAAYAASLEEDPDVLASGTDKRNTAMEPPAVRTYRTIVAWLAETASLRADYEHVKQRTLEMENQAREYLPNPVKQQLDEDGVYFEHNPGASLPKGRKPTSDSNVVYFWKVRG
jgi:hypothetical protein